jgi:hypothetical protein
MCARPGMNRGGRSNPAHAAYEPGEHTPAQLRELIADPHISVVVGDQLTEEHIAALEKHLEEKAKVAPAKGAKA